MLKRFLIVTYAFVLYTQASLALTETVNGITWTYTVANGVASVGGGSMSSPAVSPATSGPIQFHRNWEGVL